MANFFRAVLCAVTLVVLLPFLEAEDEKSTDPNEVIALMAIKGGLVDPMNYLKNWNRGDPCRLNWTGVFCHDTNDAYLHVTELQLFKRNLSGNLVPEVSLLSQLKILDFMWNNLTGSIPKEIGNITTLKLILLNGNQLSGILPDEIGNLQNLTRLQVDQNLLSGPIPKSFANLKSVKHLHMNNNSLSGQIPSELSRLPTLFHLLVDNNNLSGPLPPELAAAPALRILQADNNNFSGSSIPALYSNMSTQTLVKLSLRNCSLQGAIPDLSAMRQLGYLDLSWNQLTGSIPPNKLASNITTIDLSQNMLNGSIPSNFSGLPNLQLLSVKNNNLDGSVPSTIWDGVDLSRNRSLVLDFQNNSLQMFPAGINPPQNVTVLLYGNPICENSDGTLVTNLCRPQSVNLETSKQKTSTTMVCGTCPTEKDYEYNPSFSEQCFCAVPLGVGIRLKSPGIKDFRPYEDAFKIDLTSLLQLFPYQLYIDNYIWEVGPRLDMHLKLFPSNTSLLNMSEIVRLRHVLAGWEITLLDVFGPYELLNFTLGSYENEYPNLASSGLSKAALGGILAGAIAGAIALSAVVTALIMRKHSRTKAISRRSLSRFSVKVDGVRCFTYEEMAAATNNFDLSAQVGQGGYGIVYKGTLADGTVVAIKRAHEYSLQGSTEFCTEIELLSRLHHRNLVALVGYCDEENEQMLVYEFMSNGTLRDHLSAKSKQHLSFGLRLHIALGASKGILYLHAEADPPIFHRDVKASNILLDSKYVAKVADFGLSRLAPVPDVQGTLPAHVSTVVKGTPGYLDPEYFLTHKLTDKSDVYSLGVVFLEMLTGMKPIEHGKNIVREVKKAYQSGNISEIMDSRMGLCPPECVQSFFVLAMKCSRDETDTRPSMSDIVRELELILKMMPEAELIPLETPETYSGPMTKSTSNSRNGNYLVSSQTFTSADASSSVLSGMVTPR
ncbi:probable LRR receptor-like serine/threonine-protein kinase At1g06840 [Oryza brachyantha]|uniref:non-specific serine/threonine protein kinase n=1 Tax=Oryza brachyantha TaxID=4533 RepID=J3M876_ORYBR|nr:probable LRR receptor-like serine/threonine-protein kinase At1g06840 [Oryza brachyantha]XP_006654550.1 probable LRR receptor-like serine/threonine-protein kinase At1g06840 [Oryza brachyantha]